MLAPVSATPWTLPRKTRWALAPEPSVSDAILCYLLWPSFELLSQRSKDHPQIA